DFESLRYRGASRERCYELFSRLAFRSLVTEYAPTADTIEKDYSLVTTDDELRALVTSLRAAGEFALRVLPDQPSAMRARIAGLAFSTTDRQARYVPLQHQQSGPAVDLLSAAEGPVQLGERSVLDALRPVLEDESIRKVGHDLKFDMEV